MVAHDITYRHNYAAVFAITIKVIKVVSFDIITCSMYVYLIHIPANAISS